MSHFAVLVITPEKPVNGTLEKLLQPYHEFECTGCADEYVVEVDKTAEARAEFEAKTETRYKAPDGSIHYPYDDEFYREPTKEEKPKIGLGTGVAGGIMFTSKDWGDGKGYRAKVHFLPEGWEEVKLPASEVGTFADWCSDCYGVARLLPGHKPDLAKEHKYGWVEVDPAGNVVRLIDRTNPQKKWDWWQVGGRYTGLLSPAYDPEKDPRNIETCAICGGTGMRDDALGKDHRAKDPSYTCNGCGGKGTRAKWPTKWVNFEGDSIPRGALALERIQTEAEQKAAENYDKAQQIIAGRPFLTWQEVNAKHPDNIGRAREEYSGQAVIKDLCAWEPFVKPELYRLSREEYLARARRHAFLTFAVVKDGKWYERGEMGWWAAVIDDKGEAWVEEFERLIKDLPPTSWLTVVDCHI